MRVLATFLFLTSALAQSDSAASTAVSAAAGASNVAEAPGPATAVASDADSASGRHGSYIPLFDLDLAPYNMALEIVADALEKLADTMEPLDVPLPLVGPGYYLEVQVKSPKNPHGGPPASELNPVSIEGGQAQPVTEIDIILPGDTAVRQTILIPAQGQGAQAVAPSLIEPPSTASPAALDSYTWDREDGSSSTRAAAAPSGTIVPPMIAGTESDSALPADIASAPVEAGSSQLPSATAAAATSPMQMGGMGESESSSGARNAKTTSEVLQSATSIASNSARSPLFAGGAWGPSSSSDAVRSGAAGATHAAASSDSSSDLWAGLFPPLSSSAPGSADGAAGTTGAKPSHVESEAPASESDEQPLDSDFLESDFLDSEPTANESAGDMTMASGLLPFPPMGGPHAQQPSDASSAQPTPTGSSQAGSAGAIQTIDILDASNENALESSIDAVIHSVIQDYQAQATPKAAVGFALIHPRSVAAPEWI